jgi:hypothetical protein
VGPRLQCHDHEDIDWDAISEDDEDEEAKEDRRLLELTDRWSAEIDERAAAQNRKEDREQDRKTESTVSSDADPEKRPGSSPETADSVNGIVDQLQAVQEPAAKRCRNRETAPTQCRSFPGSSDAPILPPEPPTPVSHFRRLAREHLLLALHRPKITTSPGHPKALAETDGPQSRVSHPGLKDGKIPVKAAQRRITKALRSKAR